MGLAVERAQVLHGSCQLVSWDVGLILLTSETLVSLASAGTRRRVLQRADRPAEHLDRFLAPSAVIFSMLVSFQNPFPADEIPQVPAATEAGACGKYLESVGPLRNGPAS